MGSPFRISQQRISQQTFNNLQGGLNRLQKLQEQLSSGRLINRPSDSPVGTNDALRFRNEIKRQEQYNRNIDDGVGWLGTIDKALGEVTNSTLRVRGLVLQGINASADPVARQAIAEEVRNIRESVIAQANTEWLGRPIFVGTVNGPTESYNAAGVYQGSGAPEQILRTVGAGSPVRVNLTGPEVFGTPPNDLFDLLSQIETNLSTNNVTALSANLTALDTFRTQVQDAQSDVGARYNRLEAMKQRSTDSVLALTTGLSDVEDVDLPKTISALQLQEVAYQASLSAASRVIQPSLVDFIR
jgi:flagellar hook-associated protein 3 FlgL